MNKHEQPLFIPRAPTVKRYFTGLRRDENVWSIKKKREKERETKSKRNKTKKCKTINLAATLARRVGVRFISND